MDYSLPDVVAVYQDARQRAADLVQRYPADGEFWSLAARQLLAAVLYVIARDGALPVAAVELGAILDRLSDGHVVALLAGERDGLLSGDCGWYLNAAPKTRATVLAAASVVVESHLQEQVQGEQPLLDCCSLVEDGLVAGGEPCDGLRFDSVCITIAGASHEIYGCPVHAARVLAQHPTATVRTHTPEALETVRRLLLKTQPLAAVDE